MGKTFFAIPNVGTAEDEEMEMRIEVEERLLGWVDDAETNKYLIYAILEHVLLKLVPEMMDKTPSELLAERGVDLVASGEVDKVAGWTNGA
ncbi:hypothetical protein FOPE_02165 [Fonsecaea pedrosoi]|nr:hypothetical protein FOPE_02165 [Fonsecaea pedrosoi]